MQMLNIKPKSKLTRTIFMHGIEACLLPKGSMLIEEKSNPDFPYFLSHITYSISFFFLRKVWGWSNQPLKCL